MHISLIQNSVKDEKVDFKTRWRFLTVFCAFKNIDRSKVDGRALVWNTT